MSQTLNQERNIAQYEVNMQCLNKDFPAGGTEPSFPPQVSSPTFLFLLLVYFIHA
jgi:hypothetical protein